MLTPLPPASSTVARLIASGRATAPAGDLRALGRPPGKVSKKYGRLLLAMRDDERW
jgi:hypothetical protein